jgi:hypothetical protein
MAGTTADVVLRVRALAALVAVLLTTAGLLVLVAPFLAPLVSGGPVASAAAPAPDLEELLVLVCAVLLTVGWARLALGTSVCLVALLLRRPAGPATAWLRPTTARRLAAVLVGSSLGGLAAAPAFALPFPSPDVPDGPASSEPSAVALPLPGRPVGGRVASSSTASTPRAAAAGRIVVVRPGDSLWSLAAAHLLARGRSDSGQAVDAAWRRLYAANRAVIGPDPHLIRPGARLDLPAPAPTEGLP